MDDREAMATALELPQSVESLEFRALIDGRIGDQAMTHPRIISGVVVGTLVGFQDHGTTPLVTYAGQHEATALSARATVDLHGAHIGRDVVLMFEHGDPARPIIVGCLRQSGEPGFPGLPGRVEVDADGERLVVSANQGLVLRCGKASITLSRDGQIVVRGEHVVSHAVGVNRIKGGSVQLN